MGIVPKAETKRDQALIKDYLKKNKNGEWSYSISQLGVKYARMEGKQIFPLTPTRVHQILDKYGIKKTRTDYVKVLDKS